MFTLSMFVIISTVGFAWRVFALSLSINPTGVNTSSDLLYGIFYEDIHHSGDGGMYGEMIRNRAFQGSPGSPDGSTIRNTGFWHPVGGVTLSIDQSSPPLSPSLPYHMSMVVPANANGPVGFYNDGFWGFNVDAIKSYNASLYMRGDYTGNVECYFQNSTGTKFSSVTTTVSQTASAGWKQISWPLFQPTTSSPIPNVTFYFVFDGSALKGHTVYFNLLSVFKQTYRLHTNGLRQDLAVAVDNIGAKYLRLPGGNNLEGYRPPNYWNWTKTIGSLIDRSGRPGTWGDVDTTGLGLLELFQWASDMNQAVILGVWAGLYLDGTIIPQSDFQPYVDEVMNELEFLMGTSSTTWGNNRIQLGYSKPFTVKYVEVGNEDYMGTANVSYKAYRYHLLYNAIKAKYPSITIISTIDPPRNLAQYNAIDLHLYGSETDFVGYFNLFDQSPRFFPAFIAEYAVARPDSSTTSIGAQTFGMACAEAIFLLGCERNSDLIVGTSYASLTQEYNEAPDIVALMKHTANEILHTMSYYVVQLFANNKGSKTLSVTASGGGIGPVYWSATQNSTSTILKLVNYNGGTGSANAVNVVVQNSAASTATLITMTAPSKSSVNNLPALGGEVSTITTTKLNGVNGKFSVTFTSAYEIAILTV